MKPIVSINHQTKDAKERKGYFLTQSTKQLGPLRHGYDFPRKKRIKQVEERNEKNHADCVNDLGQQRKKKKSNKNNCGKRTEVHLQPFDLHPYLKP